MSIFADNSPLLQDINDITAPPKEKYNSGFEVELRIHTVDKDLDYQDGVYPSELKIYRDYVDSISDYMELEVTCMLGTFVYDIYPYLENIEVSIILKKQEYLNKKPVVVTDRFKGIYLVERNSHIPTNTTVKREDLNQQLPTTFIIQLLDRSAEAIRVKTTQGSFDAKLNPKNNDMSPTNLLKSVISEQVDKVLIENRPSIDKVDVEDADNKNPLKSITFPSGTRVVELVNHLQEKSDGVYNAGIGNYIQRFGANKSATSKGFFVYSLYNAKKYEKSDYKMIIYSMPSSARALSEVTYKYEDNVLRMVAKSVQAISDTKGSLVMSTGAGYRTANANSMSKKPVVMKDTGPSFKRTELVTEVVSNERADGINFAPAKGISSNHFKMNSEILAKSGKMIPISLINIDPDFIKPACACKIVFESKEGGVEEVYGVVHTATIVLGQQNKNLARSGSSPTVILNSQIDLEVFVTA